MRCITKKAFIGLIIIATAFVFSFTATTEDVAAAAKKPGRVTLSSVKAFGQNTVVVKWKKVKSAKGYQIYQNGKAVKRVGPKTLMLKKTGLKAGTSYNFKVRAYTTYKQKQWYNKKTKKWVAKKPAKKYRGKTRKATAYKYGAFSVQKIAKTSGNASPSTGSGNSGDSDTDSSGNWIGSLTVPEDKNVTISYGATTIHLGQTWTSTVLNNLRAGATGGKYECISRKGSFKFYRYQEHPVYRYATSYEESPVYNTDIYMFDVGDYDNFLMVYVHGGKISKWLTNRIDMGKNGTTALKRGALKGNGPAKALFFYRNVVVTWIPNVQKNGLLIGGFEQKLECTEQPSTYKVDQEQEKRIGLHLLNAYRYLYGSAPLEYNMYLDGEQMTWSGSFYSYTEGRELTFTNTRFGAQAWAETIRASGIMSDLHRTLYCEPLYGQEINVRGDIVFCASGDTIRACGENCSVSGPYGESTLSAYEDSIGHISTILDPNHKYVGIGISGNYHCEKFAD